MTVLACFAAVSGMVAAMLGISWLVDRSYVDFATRSVKGRVNCVKEVKSDFLNAKGEREEYWLSRQKRIGADWTGLTPEKAEVIAWRNCFRSYGGWEMKDIVPPSKP